MTTRPAGTAGSPTPDPARVSASATAVMTGRTDAAAEPSMSELRDRIAAVIRDQLWAYYISTPDMHTLADAVIAELGLQDEWALKSTIYTNPLIHPYRSREAAIADRDGASNERREDLSLVRRPVGDWMPDD